MVKSTVPDAAVQDNCLCAFLKKIVNCIGEWLGRVIRWFKGEAPPEPAQKALERQKEIQEHTSTKKITVSDVPEDVRQVIIAEAVFAQVRGETESCEIITNKDGNWWLNSLTGEARGYLDRFSGQLALIEMGRNPQETLDDILIELNEELYHFNLFIEAFNSNILAMQQEEVGPEDFFDYIPEPYTGHAKLQSLIFLLLECKEKLHELMITVKRDAAKDNAKVPRFFEGVRKLQEFLPAITVAGVLKVAIEKRLEQIANEMDFFRDEMRAERLKNGVVEDSEEAKTMKSRYEALLEKRKGEFKRFLEIRQFCSACIQNERVDYHFQKSRVQEYSSGKSSALTEIQLLYHAKETGKIKATYKCFSDSNADSDLTRDFLNMTATEIKEWGTHLFLVMGEGAPDTGNEAPDQLVDVVATGSTDEGV